MQQDSLSLIVLHIILKSWPQICAFQPFEGYYHDIGVVDGDLWTESRISILYCTVSLKNSNTGGPRVTNKLGTEGLFLS